MNTIQNLDVNSGAWERYAVPVPLVAHILLPIVKIL
jgi:hypothetical protein